MDYSVDEVETINIGILYFLRSPGLEIRSYKRI